MARAHESRAPVTAAKGESTRATGHSRRGREHTVGTPTRDWPAREFNESDVQLSNMQCALTTIKSDRHLPHLRPARSIREQYDDNPTETITGGPLLLTVADFKKGRIPEGFEVHPRTKIHKYDPLA